MRELSLYTGVGGGLLGSLILGWRTVAAVECDTYSQRVLCQRGGYMADGGEPEASGFPIYPDVRTFDATAWRGKVDIVTGGFPCQPFSQAGKRRASKDSRDMWPDTLRVLVESGAPLGFFENVPNILSVEGGAYFGNVLGSLAEAGFDAEWIVLGADDVGAPHRRKRLWILAYAHGSGEGLLARAVGGAKEALRRQAAGDLPEQCGEVPGGGEDVADSAPVSPWWRDPADVGDTDGERLEEQRVAVAGEEARSEPERAGGRQPEPGLGGVADGIPCRLDGPIPRVAVGVPERVTRLRGLGNAQVPQCMAAAFAILAERALEEQ